MIALLLRRLAQGVVIVWLVATLTFLLLHAAPGDPVSATLTDPLTPPAVREYWVHRLGLDLPLHQQYWHYLTSVASGGFGFSFPHHRPVSAVLAEALPNTLLLMGVAIVIAFAAGILIGVVQARRKGKPVDWGLGIGSLFFYSMPDFWLALMMLLVFAYWLRLFPASGMFDPVMYGFMGPWARAADRLWHLVLPAGTLALLVTAAVARFQRSALLEVAQQDFARTARAKGLGERAVIWRHSLRNALLPVITLFGLALPALLGGSVFVESVFSWPGMGTLTVNAIATRDYQLLTAVVIVTSALVVTGNLVADLLYAWADPRVRLGE
ncbi:MAG TPA: ABC transporter permease [Gemmatimonadaceae bacterium]|nr:ABC transporter permease [Gemmatimonadaceae bacterium]